MDSTNDVGRIVNSGPRHLVLKRFQIDLTSLSVLFGDMVSRSDLLVGLPAGRMRRASPCAAHVLSAECLLCSSLEC